MLAQTLNLDIQQRHRPRYDFNYEAWDMDGYLAPDSVMPQRCLLDIPLTTGGNSNWSHA